MARAVRFDRYGDRDVLYVADVAVPEPAVGEVVVEVRAAGINPGEVAIRSGALESRFPATFPSGEGSDLAGVVSAVGEGVTEFAVGDEVLGWSWRRSSHAEYVAVPVTQLIDKPSQLSWEVAGSLYVVGCTAYAAVRAVGPRQGDTVAVSGAAGGVGTVVVQLLRTKGATVLGIASPPHHDWLAAHGVIPVSYGDGLADRFELPRRTASMPSSTSSGRSTCSSRSTSASHRTASRPPSRGEKANELGTKSEGSVDASTTEVLSEMADLVASGRIEIPIAATYKLEQVRDAFAELEQRHTLGKIVLIP